jgi:DNA-binding SARP family transcriptional activator
MGILQVGLLGGVRVTHDNWLTKATITREIQALLAYLLLHRHRVHSREVLADIFWGQHTQERARGSLNTALWKLKKVLEPAGIPAGTYLRTNYSGEVRFNDESPHWLDIEVFEEEIKRILICPFQTAESKHLIDLERVVELYKGDLLEGFYNDWALQERERLRALHLKALVYLLKYYGFQKFYDKAIGFGQQILSLDPLREDIHREMMKVYVRHGQRAMAVRQYELCRSMLASELGIPPMEETQALYAQILHGTDMSHPIVISAEQTSFAQALRQLSDASQAIELATEQIQRALRLIAQNSKQID